MNHRSFKIGLAQLVYENLNRVLGTHSDPLHWMMTTLRIIIAKPDVSLRSMIAFLQAVNRMSAFRQQEREFSLLFPPRPVVTAGFIIQPFKSV